MHKAYACVFTKLKRLASRKSVVFRLYRLNKTLGAINYVYV